MRKKSPSQQLLALAVARLAPYPAVFLPTPIGGFEVVFPNFARLAAYGHDLTAAQKAAAANLTAELTGLLKAGDEPPAPSDPDRLVAGEDEPPGSKLFMVAPETEVIAMRLGIKRRERGINLASLGRFGKK